MGIAYKCNRHGIWTGTFVDATHDDAIAECKRLAREVSDGYLPIDGRIVRVGLVEESDMPARITRRVWLAGGGKPSHQFETMKTGTVR